MKERNWYGCIARRARICPLALTLALTLAPAASEAGILRDVDKPQTEKPQSQKPQAVKPQAVKPQTEVETNAVTNNAAGGKGSCGEQAEVAGKGEGMAGKSGSKDPGGNGTREKILQMPRQLWATAKGLAKGATAKPPPSAPGCTAGSQTLPRHGFACCNLHYDGDWINDGNYAELPMIPAGTPIEVLSYGRNRAYVKVDGKPMRLGHDYGRDQESLETWVNKIVVKEDPRPRIGAYPAAIREAIHEGKVTLGMTREQAILSVGYPQTSENASLDAPVWRIWRSRRGEYQLNFRPDGHLGSVTGDDEVTSLMTYRQGK